MAKKEIKANNNFSGKIKCIINYNNTKTPFFFNTNLSIKEIKSIILKKLTQRNLDDIKGEQNKSFDNVNQSKKSQVINNSIDNSLNKSNLEEDSKLNKKNSFYSENKISNNEENELNNSINSDSHISNYKKGKYKKINIFYKGKEIINEEEIIGNLISNNGSEVIELSVIILYLNDSTFFDDNRTKEKLINKLTDKCKFHKENKELFICTTCGMAFCKNCSDKHKNHDIIERKNIISFTNELKSLNEELNNSLSESNIYNLYNIYEIKENNNNNYNTSMEKLQNRLENIKKMHKGIVNNYKRDLDKSLPYLMEYKEKIEQLIDNSYKLETIKDEQQFMDYYYWYTNIKQKNLKIKQEIQNLEKNRQYFNKLLEDFDTIIQNIYSKTEEDYKSIKKFYYNYNTENENQFRSINSNSTISSKLSDQNNQNIPKLNLFNLLSQNEGKKNNLKKQNKNEIQKESQSNEINSINGKDEIKNSKISSKSNSNNIFQNKKNSLNNKYNFNKDINLKKKILYSQRFSKKYFEKIEEKSEMDESQEEANINYIKNIYNIKPETQNIYYFDFETRKVNEIAVNFNNLNIEYFDQYQSTLNYENNFYFSGGYNSSKLFCKYNQEENIFITLKEIPSGHSCHGMLGMENYIFIISGTKSKKVEKYDTINDTWEKLSELKESRLWPSCLEYNNKYIFVFGGKCQNSLKENNIIIEKLDLSMENNKWEQLNFNYDNKIILPFDFGLIHINDNSDNSFLLMGGKYNNNDNNMNDCYKIIINNEKIDIKKDMDFKLSKNEDFKGKMFTKFKNYYYGEFSSLSYDTFYLINAYNKSIKEISSY